MPDFETSPNQRIIVIHRDKITEPFVYMSKDNMINAYKELNATSLYFYILLACNKDKYAFAFSPKAIYNKFGMPISTSQDQFKKLVEKGYIVQREEGSNVFDFYEVPPKSEDKK